MQAKPDYKQLKQTQSTKKSALDFGTASRVTNKLNTGFQELVQDYHSPEIYNRMRSKVLQAMRTYTVLPLGEKNLWDGATELLEGFEFNYESKYKDFQTCGWLTGKCMLKTKCAFNKSRLYQKLAFISCPLRGG